MTRQEALSRESESPHAETSRSQTPSSRLLWVGGIVLLGGVWILARSSGTQTDAPQTAAPAPVAARPSDPVRPANESPNVAPDPQALAAVLVSGDPAARRGAAGALAAMGEPARSVLPSLGRALRDPDPVVCAHAAQAIWNIDRDPAAVARLADLLRSRDDEVRRLAAYLLGSIGPDAKPALPALKWEQTYNHGMLRLYAAEAIARIDPADRGAVEALLGGLRSNEAEQRALAAFALGSIASRHAPRVVPELRSALHDDDLRVRTAADAALSVLGASAQADGPSRQSATTSRQPDRGPARDSA